jgi:calcium/calmodulin-dependent protein kinase I
MDKYPLFSCDTNFLRVDGGELFERIFERGFYSEKEACQVMRKVVDAVKYLHEQNIIHRDLKVRKTIFKSNDPFKPENLLVKKGNDTHVMLSDFGLSRILGDDSMASTACGTPFYVGEL